jgi:hypothetical protein
MRAGLCRPRCSFHQTKGNRRAAFANKVYMK